MVTYLQYSNQPTRKVHVLTVNTRSKKSGVVAVDMVVKSSGIYKIIEFTDRKVMKKVAPALEVVLHNGPQYKIYYTNLTLAQAKQRIVDYIQDYINIVIKQQMNEKHEIQSILGIK